MIGNVGSCTPDRPCVIPVGLGLMAPSGVLMIGLALVLRDLVHQHLGTVWATLAIIVGATLSLALAPPTLALASGLAFLHSEVADLAVYAPLYRRRLLLAVLLSGIVGAAIDSAVFLRIAFGSLQFVEGQVVGKLLMTLVALPFIAVLPRSVRA